MMSRRAPWGLIVLAALFFVPAAGSRYYTFLANDVVIWALFATSLNLLVGYAGLVSFGHAAYFGIGAYTTGLLMKKLGVSFLLAFPAAGLVAGLFALVFGFFCVRLTRIYFAMLTLAFAQLLYFIGFHLSSWTGGDDGLRGIPQLTLGFPGFPVSLEKPLAFYYFCFVLVGLAVALLKRILDSPFGAVLQAIRENSDRAVACGYDIDRVKLLSFVFSAMFAGLAGALDALRLTVVPIESLYWTTSGQVVMMTLLGGAGTFFGPFVGATAFLVLEDRLSAFTESWPLVIGAIFSAFVLFLPRGIWGTIIGGFHGRQSA